MIDQYERRLWERIRRLCPGVRLSEIGAFPEKEAEAVLRELLETGCLSQNAANIAAARKAVRQLPPEWVSAHLPKVVPNCLFREREWQEWEFRRAAEMLREPFPDAFAWLTDWAEALHHPKVAEAIEDMREGSP